MQSSLIILIGASGSGKTTVVHRLQEETPGRFRMCFFDSIGIPSDDEMIRGYGTVEEWQRAKTIEWIKTIKKKYLKERDVIFDVQTRPTFIEEAVKEADIENFRIILLDCSDTMRRERLMARGQVELANEQMMGWAEYLRRECIKGEYPIIDTTHLSVEEVIVKLELT